MNYNYPLIAIHRVSNKTEVLYTEEDVKNFVKKFGWWTRESWIFSDSIRRIYDSYFYHPSEYRRDPDWIMRDDWGRKVDPRHFNFDSWRGNEARRKQILRAMELGLPIPGIGHSNPWKFDKMRKKHGGSGQAARAASRADYESREYGVKKKRKLKYVDPWTYD